MKITFVGSEATPFAKTGGLADVLGSLPKTLADMGHDVSLIMPKHQAIKDNFESELTTVYTGTTRVHHEDKYIGIQTFTHEKVKVYFIDNEYYFGLRPHLYGDYDDGERYGYFAHATLNALMHVLPPQDLLHLNDWQTGLIAYLLKYDVKYAHLAPLKTIFTIHNIAYQGRFSKELMSHLNTDYSDLLEFDDVINFLKTGIMTADQVTTVSPTYKENLKHAYFAYGMQGVLKMRESSFSGIINGIDPDTFDPSSDDALEKTYTTQTFVSGKKANKKALMNQFGLKNPQLPLVGMVSRITESKGFSLVADVIPSMVEKGLINFVLLGSGDPYYEDTFQYLHDSNPDHLGVYFGYSDGLARQVYAGADLFLMPSRFEPCGLSQLIAMRYGTLPVVHKTGGLKDTVEPFNEYTLEGTGFGFDTFDSDDLKQALLLAISVHGESDTFKMLQKRAMEQDFSWTQSANDYITLYQEVMKRG